MLTRRKKLGSKNGDALAAAVLQRALAQPRLAGEVVRWAYPCDDDHRRTTRISLGTGRARRPPGLRSTRIGVPPVVPSLERVLELFRDVGSL